MDRKYILFGVTFLLALILDQATKMWVWTNLIENVSEIPVIDGWFSIVHAQNPGAAMGFLRSFEHRKLVFLGFTVVAILVIGDMIRKLPKDDRFMSTVLGLILSGAVGNAIDRVHKGTVTDFLRVYSDHPPLRKWLIETFGTNEWPSFNVADSALVVGVILFMIHYLFLEETPEPAKAAEPSTGGAPGGAPPAAESSATADAV